MVRLLLGVCVLGCFGIVINALEPTKIVDQGIYTLESQNDGNYLTASPDSILGKTRLRQYTEASSRSQKWLFTITDKADQLWAIEPVTGENTVLGDSLWKISYVGHGKYQFESTTTNLCLHSPGGGRPNTERECGKNNPNQRWNVQSTKAPVDP